MGVTDYSLLVGVKNMQYDIDSNSTGRQRLSSSFSAETPFFQPQQSQHVMSMMRESERRNNNVSFNLNTHHAKPAAGADQDLTSPPAAADSFSNAYPARAVIAPAEYYLGVIDILQTWSLSKWAERMFKVNVLNQPAEGYRR